ncbi:MAG: hypothetical protein IJK64_05070 [Clostridia bacterium]|nr:hypothetical protein [Clostridia bacterium]
MEFVTNIIAQVRDLVAGLGEFDAAGVLGQVKDMLANLNLDSIKAFIENIIAMFA